MPSEFWVMRIPLSMKSSHVASIALAAPHPAPHPSFAVVDVLAITYGGGSGPPPAPCVRTSTGPDHAPQPTSLMPRTRST